MIILDISALDGTQARPALDAPAFDAVELGEDESP